MMDGEQRTTLVVGDEATTAALSAPGHNSGDGVSGGGDSGGGGNGKSARPGRVLGVDNYLDALGEMSRTAVGAIVGRIDAMNGAMEPTVAALRELGPQCRIVLLVDPDQEPQARRAMELGIDDYLVSPASADAVRNALRPRGRAAESQRNGLATAPAQPAPPSILPRAGTDQPLGDTDLIQQLLTHRAGVRDLAIQIIRQRVPGHELAWNDEPPADDAGESAAVQSQGRTFGHLVSPTLRPSQLAAFATWLGQWLALDDRIATLEQQTHRDELTGVFNRRYFHQFLADTLARARAERFRVTVMIYDIDDFKSYNDRYGHGAGDDILRETARLMQSVVRKHDVVARIGGDEFAVVFWDAEPPRRENSLHPHNVRSAAVRFQRAICEHRFPKLAEQAPGTLTISGGLASFPWDGQTPENLLHVADQMLLESKRHGKNVITFGPGAMKVCGLNGPRDEAPA